MPQPAPNSAGPDRSWCWSATREAAGRTVPSVTRSAPTNAASDQVTSAIPRSAASRSSGPQKAAGGRAPRANQGSRCRDFTSSRRSSRWVLGSSRPMSWVVREARKDAPVRRCGGGEGRPLLGRTWEESTGRSPARSRRQTDVCQPQAVPQLLDSVLTLQRENAPHGALHDERHGSPAAGPRLLDPGCTCGKVPLR